MGIICSVEEEPSSGRKLLALKPHNFEALKLRFDSLRQEACIKLFTTDKSQFKGEDVWFSGLIRFDLNKSKHAEYKVFGETSKGADTYCAAWLSGNDLMLPLWTTNDDQIRRRD